MTSKIPSLSGIIYSKETKTWPNKNKDLPDHEFYSFILEAEFGDQGRTLKSLPKFTLKMGLTFEEYAIGDHVEIDYYPLRKEIKKKDGSGTWWKEENVVLFMKFSDIQSPEKPKKDAKIRVPSMSDVSELENTATVEDVFIPKRPSQMVEIDDESDLPF